MMIAIMNKELKLYYNLIHFDIYDEDVKVVTKIPIHSVLTRVFQLLDREIDYKITGHEVYLDKTDQVNLCNIIIKTERQTINVQVIPSIHIIDYKGIENSLVESRKHLLKKQLFKYSEELLHLLMDKANVELCVVHDELVKVNDYMIIEHWNQLPIKFE